MMKRRILITTDFSINAQNAIDYAIDLYKQNVCDFYILNTYNVEAFTMELTAINSLEKSKQKSIGGLTNILDRLSVINNSPNHQFHMISEFGSLIEIMKKIIAKRDIDIVIMGTKGNTDSRTLIYGSQTVFAMEKIRNCPVLAIPAKATFKKIKEIVFPTGYRTHYKSSEFQYLVDIAKNTGAAIRILHVLNKHKQLNENQLNKQRLLKDYFEELEYSFHISHDTDVQSALNSFIESRNSDMVVFINKKHSFFSWILSKPMVKNLMYHSTIPILALHDLRN
ncbi:universal stress protein [Kordia sp. YSTF-M3]|uniref:Universal stress protein n=1 Tax=Kordia aestuariivivens TaxID=2759037 RepID=A0ABR7Q9B8_9FLAO|nr:universal stress protein [Kordia aestuariivivens]MBC8755018.1 universal stress protein [Kordia aestuariivivens]